MRLIKHIKRWNKWRKGSLNSWWWKFLVLIGIGKLPTFVLTLTDDEADGIFKTFDERIEENWRNGRL